MITKTKQNKATFNDKGHQSTLVRGEHFNPLFLHKSGSVPNDQSERQSSILDSQSNSLSKYDDHIKERLKSKEKAA